MSKRVVLVCGPTASGKTAMGVALAKEFGGEVVSTDSMQIYRQMDIGTAKPTREEMEGVPHHMIDVVEPWEDYSVARYVQEATPIVEDIISRGKIPFLVGGTGLYMDNLLSGREFAPFSGEIREKLTRQAREEGLESLYRRLGEVDPQRQRELQPGDEKRIIRALEIFEETGETMTEYHRRSQQVPPRFEALRLGLCFEDREDMKARIDTRVDRMMEQGLVEEVDRLLKSGISPRATSMQAIGYKEMAQAVLENGDVKAAAEEVKLRSRQYAKRQLSWFRRYGDTHWFSWPHQPDFSQGLQDSTAFLRQRGL